MKLGRTTALKLLPFLGLGTLCIADRHCLLCSFSLIIIILALAQAPSYVDPENGITFWGVTDPVHSVTYGYAFPPLNAGYDEFIGQIVAPIDTKWAGVSPGGGMLNNLLLVAWPDGDKIVSSARMAK